MRKIKRNDIEDVLALTPTQEGMLFHYLKDPGSDLYFEQLSLRISGNIDIDAVEQAWNNVAMTNEMLRTVFRWEKLKNPTQVVLKSETIKFRYHDFVVKAGEEKEKRLEKLKINDREKPFDLSDVPFRITLCKIADTEYELIISNHHILYDGWSTGIILKEFFAAYADLVNNMIPLRKVKPAFKEFVQKTRDKKWKDKEKIFWIDQLDGLDGPAELSIKNRFEKGAGGSGIYQTGFDTVATNDLEQYAKTYKVSLAVLLYSAWGILLQNYNNTHDVIFGTTVSGRRTKLKGIEKMVGLFINTLPLRVTSGTEKNETVEDFLARVNHALQKREDFETSSLVDIKTYCNFAANQDMFDNILVIENYPLDKRLKQENNSLSIDSYSIFEKTHYDLTVAVIPGDQLKIVFDYRSELFAKEDVKRLSHHYTAIIKNLIKNSHQKLASVEMLSTQEKKRILYEFNDTDVEFPPHQTIFQLFEQQAHRTPQHIAVTGTARSGASATKETLTYRELDEKSNRLANLLRRRGITVNAATGILIERSVEVVVAILSVLKAGGAYLPIDPQYPDNRIISMLKESGAPFLLTTLAIAAKRNLSSLSLPQEILVQDRDELIQQLQQESAASLEPLSGPDDLIYIIFTSGSTGKPKGAGVYHRGFMNLMLWFVDEFQLNPEDRNLLLTSLSFDLTQKNLYASLITGGGLCIPAFDYFEPRTLLKEIHNNSVTWINCTPSMFYKLVEEEAAAQQDQLTPLRYVFLGGEPISVSRLLHWLELEDNNALLVNTYGPTECTDISNYYCIREPRMFLDQPIPVGRAVSNVKLYIPGRNLQPLPVGVAGELLIGGAGVGIGYVNDNQLTAQKFITHSFSVEEPPQKLYRTGDLAKWLPDGNIEFLGRIDNQVKIRGFRIELGEIESRLLAHPHVKEVLVMARDADADHRYLCAYLVPQATTPLQEPQLRDFLAVDLPDYMVPAYFVTLEKMPVNPNGKVDRKALPEPLRTDVGSYVSPRNQRERTLLDIWSQVLGMESSTIGIDDNFFRLGGHSLNVVRLVSRIHKEFNIAIPLGEIFKSPTVRALSRYMNYSEKDEQRSIQPVEEKEYYEFSPVQERFFVFQKMEPHSISYNIPDLLRLDGPVLKDKFEDVARQLIRRHESLRTSFEQVAGKSVQRVHAPEDSPFEMEYFDIRSCVTPAEGGNIPVEVAALEKNFVRPFDLSRPPLMRMALVNVAPESCFLMFDMHHIISDGVSMGIVIKEFLALYNGEELPPPACTYNDYVYWCKAGKKSGIKRVEQLPELQAHTDPPEEVLNLPTDFVRPPIPSFKGKTIIFEITEAEKKAAMALALQQDVTLYVLLLAVFNVFLSKLSSQENIVVGSPISGRRHQDLEGLIGLFINTMVLRNYPNAEKEFSQFLAEVKQSFVQAAEIQEYQYEKLVDEIRTARETGRNPLFDVMFVLQNMEMPEIKFPGLTVTRCIRREDSSKFDMTLYCEENYNHRFKLEYSSALFEPETIRRFIRYFKTVIAHVLADPHKKISQIEILSPEEKQRILYDFNDTAVEYPAHLTIFQLFEQQAVRTPKNIAITGTVRGRRSNQPVTLTYRQLDEKTNRLANLLRKRGVTVNAATGILMERTVDVMVAILSVIKAGGAYLPIDPEYPDKRINSMLVESGASFLLTTGSIAAKRDLSSLSMSQEVLVLDQEELVRQLQQESCAPLQPLSGPGDLIYIIFTSGSTGKPKGAGVYHRGFVNLLHWFVTEFQLNPEDRNLLLTSLSFDLTQKNLYASLITGGRLCIPSFNYFEPRTLLKEIHDNSITWINCTPSMFNKLVEDETVAPTKQLSLLRYVFLGGEPISMPALIHWLESEDCIALIVNTYGPTECTDISNYFCIREPREFLEHAIPVGQAVDNVKLYIPDKNLNPLPIGVAGELLIGGAGVGIGYVNDKELTARKFLSHSFAADEPPQKLYRTGDLAKWLPDGNIEFLGRIDHQVKIRGFRIELGEIESRLLDHPKVKEVLVMARDGQMEEKYLCAYIVVLHTPGDLQEELRDHLAVELPDYMVPAYFIMMEKMPLNPNGKVDRKALPEPQPAESGNYVPAADDIQKVLVEIWAEVLGMDRQRIGIYDNFFRLGGHSLKAAGLVGRIHNEFSVEIPIGELFKAPTVKGISQFIKKNQRSIYSFLKPLEKREYYELSSAQKRLFFIHLLDPKAMTYNLPGMMKLQGLLNPGNKERIQWAFQQLINRHESLRTSFEMRRDQPIQKIHDTVEFVVEYSHSPESFFRSFDLSLAPLLRVGLTESGPKQYDLMFDMHHIVSDGVSMAVLIEEFTSFYSRNPLSELPFQYKDFAIWQNSLLSSGKMEQQAAYWQSRFQGEIPVLNLPIDFPRPPVKQFAGASLNFDIPPSQTTQLMQLAHETDSTLYMVLFALFNLLLSKLSGQQDIVTGTVAAGRSRYEFENIIGMFVNTLAIRTDVSGMIPFSDFLVVVKENVLAAFENQDYQYEELVETLNIERDLSRNPLFDTMFILQNMSIPRLELAGLALETDPYETGISKFDLTFRGEEAGEKLIFDVDYSTNLFAPQTISRFIDYFKTLVTRIADKTNRHILIGEIEIISTAERQQLIYDFNNTQSPWPSSKTLHQLFEEQVQKTPENIALIFKDESLTYQAVDERAGKLSSLLMEKGVKPGTIAVLMVERSIGMLVSLLAILKAGCAYLPVDTDYPIQRIQYILDDSFSRFLVTRSHLLNKSPLQLDPAVTIIDIDDEKIYNEAHHTPSPQVTRSSEYPAYVIYTSGSTGKPKGVLVEHASAVNLVFCQMELFHITVHDRILQFSSTCFDASVEQIFITLFSGAALVLTDTHTLLDADKFETLVSSRSITHIHAVPAFLSNIRLTDTSGLKRVVSGGDVCPVPLARKWSLGFDFYNKYGPTETTVTSIEKKIEVVDDASPRLPIGKPVANTTVYLFDKYMRLVPIGAVGEIFIGGKGVTRGYLNRPQLTAETFITNPLVEGERLYRTGDLARRLPEGDIEFLGRTDFQVKIRGHRIEAGEIENLLVKHQDIKEAVVAVRRESGDNYLCAYIVLVSPQPPETVNFSLWRDYLLSFLPAYMIPSHFVLLQMIPLNANGKIDRNALPQPELTPVETYAAPRDKLEQALVDIWSRVLAVESSRVGIDDNFFHLGGHSLKAVRLVARMHEEFKVVIPLAEIFKTSTIRGMALYIKDAGTHGFSSLEKAEQKDYYPLSSAQKRLYFQQSMNRDSIAYNMPAVLKLTGHIDQDKIAAAFQKLIQRHEILRTSFRVFHDEPVQMIHPHLPFDIRYYPGTDTTAAAAVKQWVQVFDLSEAPLLRVVLVQQEEKKHLLITDMHHIISDGISSRILVEEFIHFYSGGQLPPLKFQYKDYAQWQSSAEYKRSAAAQEDFWKEQLDGDIPLLDLPVDFPRPAVQSVEGSTIAFELNPQKTAALNALALQQGTTLYMVLLAMYYILLSKLSGAQDIVVGTPTAGRRHTDLEGIIGMFVNTLALRNFPTGEKNFKEFLHQIKTRALQAFENQDYQYEKLVAKLARRDPARNPLFDTMFVLQNLDEAEIQLPGLKLSPYNAPNRTSKFDLMLIAAESGQTLHFTFEYSTRLFKEATIQCFATYYQKIIDAVLRQSPRRLQLSQIQLISQEQKQRILHQYNATASNYPKNQTIQSLFLQQAAQTPHRVALVAPSCNSHTSHNSHVVQISYSHLNHQSHTLSAHLIQTGIIPGSIVAVPAHRSAETIIAILAILKAGCAYLPINPDYPEERKQYLLRDADAVQWPADIPLHHNPKIPAAAHSPQSQSSLNLAYVIYTSGSTGNPKGVMIEHRSVVRLVQNTDYVTFPQGDRILQTGALDFDASTFEIWGALLNGLQLYLVDKETILTPLLFKETLLARGITTIFMTTALFNRMVDQDRDIFCSLSNLLVGGEVASIDHFERVRCAAPHLNLIHCYGPTENTTFSLTHPIRRQYKGILPIGLPIANSTAYIVDRYNHLVPQGVPGELLVGGDGLGRGYLNNPQLTLDKFIHLRLEESPGSAPIRLYRTGDRALLLPGGHIHFLGRIDQQVKIRGFRIEPGEIEVHLMRLDSISEAVVTVKQSGHEKYLCAYVTAALNRTLEPAEIKEDMSLMVPAHMIPPIILQLEKMPLKPSGKIDKKQLPEPGSLLSTAHLIPPRDDFEKKLAHIWASVLETDIQHIGIHSDFFDLGGHSLNAAVLASRIHKVFNVKIPLKEIFQRTSLQEMTQYIKQESPLTAGENSFTRIPAVEDKEYYPLSPAQKRLYILHRMDQQGTGYNVPSLLVLEGDANPEKLENVFRQLILRHESLRTSFTLIGEEAVQRVHEDASFTMERHPAPQSGDREIIRHFVRPFCLDETPLMRAALIILEPGRHLLLADMHHIITDGMSMERFTRDFIAIYAGETLPLLNIRYRDYSQWRNSEAERQHLESQQAYWLERYREPVPVAEFPLDFPRPAEQQFDGRAFHFEISPQQGARLKEFAREGGTTLYTVMLTLYSIFLAKITGSRDIVVGTPTAGRSHADLQPLVGMFVNTLPLRCRPTGEKTVNQYLVETNTNTLEALANQDYPYEELVASLDLLRDTSRNPLFDTMLSLQNIDASRKDISVPGLTFSPYPYEEDRAKFDISLWVTETPAALQCSFGYCTSLFKEETIRRFARYLDQLVTQITTRPQEPISHMEIASPLEKQRALEEFNNTRRSYPQHKTIHCLLEEQARQTPDRTAVVAMADRDMHLTYNEINHNADILALQLRREGVAPGTVVALMVERSLEMVAGSIALLKAGAAYLPIDPAYPLERTRYILEDSGTQLLLTAGPMPAGLAPGVRVIDIHALLHDHRVDAHDESLFATHPENTAYIIYTSGSTGRPKGTLVRHSGVVNILLNLQRLFPCGSRHALLLKTNHTFDVSVTELFGWFPGGGKAIILPPRMEGDPAAITDAIQRHHVTHINFVPSMFSVFADRVTGTAPWADGLHIFLAGEALPPSVVRTFANNHPRCKLENLYGPTEATIYASHYSLDQWQGTGNIPIGTPLDNTTLYIFDNYKKLLPIGITGELYIGGVGLAAGYLNRPLLTSQKFIDNPYVSGEKLFRTGDRARRLPDGNIQFHGRIDHQVKIRGFRVECGEIETLLANHEDIREVVVTSRPHPGGDTYLCAYIVPNSQPYHLAARDSLTDRLRHHLAGRLPQYMIPSYFITLNLLPLSPSGKLDRNMLPLPEVETSSTYTAPTNEIEEKLAQIWAGILALEKDKISIDQNFFRLGGHSLKAVRLLSRIHKELKVDVPLPEMFKRSTIRDLALYIQTASGDNYNSINKAADKEYYQLSSAQKRLYFLAQVDPRSTVYNMPLPMLLEGNPDKEKLQQTFYSLIKRHESLRTYFMVRDNQPVQGILQEVPFEIQCSNLPENNEEPVLPPVRPFPLDRAPLLRVELFKIHRQRHILMVDMHHIISDGISQHILMREFIAIYNHLKLPPLRLQYRDYAQWQASEEYRQVAARQENFWKDQLYGDIPLLELPLDFPRPTQQHFEGNHYTFELDPQESTALNASALQEGITLYMVLLAAYYILLSKLSSADDIIVGTPSAGRRHADLEGVIGMFVNTLALRNFPNGTKTYKEFLHQIKDRALQAFQNQDYQYESLVEELKRRDLGRNPLFDTMFVLQNLDMSEFHLPGLKLSPYDISIRTSKFDLMLIAAEARQSLRFTFEYSTRLFKETTIECFARYYKRIISTLLQPSSRDLLLSEIQLISPEQKQRILYQYNATATDYPNTQTIHGLFQRQAAQTPHRIALIAPSHSSHSSQIVQFSYCHLNQQAHNLSIHLSQLGIIPGSIVAVPAHRSVATIIAVLSVLKAGASYLPINPDYPEERKELLLRDADALPWPIDAPFHARHASAVHPEQNQSSRSLAYIMYTSGSTGNPKGVMVEHRSVVRLVQNTNYVRFPQGDRLLQTGALDFDASTFEIWGALLNGLQLCLVNKETILSPAILKNTLRTLDISTIWMTSPLFNRMADQDVEIFYGLRNLLVGGDVLSPVHIERVRQAVPGLNIINGYGPTENTTFSLTHPICEQYDADIPIGKPIANSTAYIVDPNHRLVPEGVPGELLVGGDGMGRGYLNNPQLTAEKFIHIPLAGHADDNPVRLYRTGDRACMLPEGNIRFLGRIDQQVKIRGFRIEPGEIENQLTRLQDISQAVVIVKQADQEKYLCAYVTADGQRKLEPAEIKEKLSSKMPDHMIPPVIMQLQTMPLKPSGKIDKKQLPDPQLERASNYTAARDNIESRLVDVWAAVLGIESSAIGIDADFFDLGGHSLKATLLAAAINKEFYAQIPLMEIFQSPTIRLMANFIKDADLYRHSPVQPSEEKEYYPLSPAQRRLYIVEQMAGPSTNYNVALTLKLDGELSRDKLELVFRKLCTRHESLRTSFHIIGSRPVQRVHRHVTFTLQYEEAGAVGLDIDLLTRRTAQLMNRPFDLANAPLFVARLVKITGTRHILSFNMHHIVTDGTSMQLLIKEMQSFYTGQNPPLPTLQYKDYCQWQNRMIRAGDIDRQETFWLDLYCGDLPLLELPVDFPRPSQQKFVGAGVSFMVDKEQTASLNHMARQQEATMYMVLLAVYNVFLSKLCYLEDILVGTSAAGRRAAGLETVVGMFINTLCLRNRPHAGLPFNRFLQELKQRSIDAFENQDYQFEDLVEKIAVKHIPGRNPLFNVNFSFHNEIRDTGTGGEDIPGLRMTPHNPDAVAAKFDLTLQAVEKEGILYLTFQYDTALFKEKSIRTFCENFKQVLSSVIQNPQQLIADIKMISHTQEQEMMSNVFDDLEEE